MLALASLQWQACSRRRCPRFKPASSLAWYVRSVNGTPHRRGGAGPRPPLLPAGRHVVATSEHWYDEEEEFNSLTDAMRPKTVVLVAVPSQPSPEDSSSVVEALRSYLKPLTFNQAFASVMALPFAEQLWSGRNGAPYFLKVRTRPALGAADSGAASSAAEVWQELLQQNWQVQLDAGLGGPVQENEALLVVCSAQGVTQLLTTAGAELAALPRPASVSVLQVAGTQAGDPVEWRLLDKWLRFVAGVHAVAGEVANRRDILAAIGSGTAAPTH